MDRRTFFASTVGLLLMPKAGYQFDGLRHTVRFEADFREFYRVLLGDAARFELFDNGATQVDKSLARLTEAFGILNG
jgi:hypothetical protein